MRLWTMQPLRVWEEVQRAGVYRCDAALCWMAEELPHAYAWLAREMTKRVGPPPQGVVYPVWAWYMQKWQAQKTRPAQRAVGLWPRRRGLLLYRTGDRAGARIAF